MHLELFVAAFLFVVHCLEFEDKMLVDRKVQKNCPLVNKDTKSMKKFIVFPLLNHDLEGLF